MTFRRLCLHNWRWKLFSLLLASAIWFYVDALAPKSAIVKRNPVSRTSTITFLERFPVKLLSVAGDLHAYTLEPGTVEVSLSGETDAVNAVFEEDVQVWVDLTTIPRPVNNADVTNEFNLKVQVQTPVPGVAARADPSAVKGRQFLQNHPAPKSPPANARP